MESQKHKVATNVSLVTTQRTKNNTKKQERQKGRKRKKEVTFTHVGLETKPTFYLWDESQRIADFTFSRLGKIWDGREIVKSPIVWERCMSKLYNILGIFMCLLSVRYQMNKIESN